MKNATYKLLCLLLSVTMLLAVVPAVSAATPAELRQVIAGHTKAVAGLEWKLETRRYVDHRLEDERKELMHSVGARSTIFYEYKRMPLPTRGPLTEYNSVSLEGFKHQLVDGFLPTDDMNSYYGMNANSFVTDVLSRLIPDPILGVKDALTAEGLTPLFSGVDLSAKNSKAAVAGISYEDAMVAYGNLKLGDILLAWDDEADGRAMPRLHAMVITEFDNENRGAVTVTYPATTNLKYYFTCSKCGAESTEEPNGQVISKHMVSENYAFSRWMTHEETYPNSGCNGEWKAEGCSTWRTETVSFDQLFGHNGAAVPFGSVCYLPYTLDVYKTGQAAPLDIKVTTDATADNITAGFKAKVESNYRIVRVDAVLSQMGKADQVFTNIPEWDDWSYEYQNDALDKTLFENETGDYTLTLKVHSGPIEDASKVVAPVTDVFTLDLQLTDPSFYMVVDQGMVHQGQNLTVTVNGMEDGITGAQVTMGCDQERFAFNMEASKNVNANTNVNFVENEDGTVTASYVGSAVDKDEPLFHVCFTAVRTGKDITAAADIQPFVISSARVAKTANATETDFVPARAGGEQPRVGIGLNIGVYKNYAPGYDLVLLLASASEATATYDGQSMFDITRTNMRVDGKGFSHVYAYVTPTAELDLVSAKYLGMSFSADTKGRQMNITMDVDRNGGVDIGDVQTICHIANGALPLEGNMEKFLLADVDRNGKVELADAKIVFALLK